MEKVPRTYIEEIEITPDLGGFHITVILNDRSRGSAVLTLEGKDHEIITGEQSYIRIEDPRLWSPEDPFLYQFDIRFNEDTVHSYVGLRTFGVGPDE
ncbi:MAG: hypothetical protein IJJ95_04725, partial [Spirochaetales bacterium]|nr:hypothetical protein [Spirochaetales bacterium]